MKQAERTYPFGKSMMLNVIYDTLERLGVSAISSNSEDGIIKFHTDGAELILKINTVYPQETTRVMNASETENIDCDFTDALFDEISSTISTTKAKP